MIRVLLVKGVRIMSKRRGRGMSKREMKRVLNNGIESADAAKKALLKLKEDYKINIKCQTVQRKLLA